MHFCWFFPCSIWEISNNAVVIEQVRRHPRGRSSNKAFGGHLLRSYKFCNLAHFCELRMEISSVHAFFVVFSLLHMRSIAKRCYLCLGVWTPGLVL